MFLGGGLFLEDFKKLKLPPKLRVAFVGRSNVGKSSLINAIFERKIARVSREPGKTREINFFDKGKWILVDLPGYGFAKVSHDSRDQWRIAITNWLKHDDLLRVVVSLVDSRHGFQPKDIDLLEMLKDLGLPFIVVFTKMDKHKSGTLKMKAKKLLSDQAEKLGLSEFVFVSAEKKDGIKELNSRIQAKISA